MDDALILEDGRANLEIILSRIPRGYSISVARDSSEFRRYLEFGEAKIYFLDDTVPGVDGVPDRRFIENCELLLKRNAKARVYYIGSTPRPMEEAYCDQNMIPIIDRDRIHEIITQKEDLTF